MGEAFSATTHQWKGSSGTHSTGIFWLSGWKAGDDKSWRGGCLLAHITLATHAPFKVFIPGTARTSPTTTPSSFNSVTLEFFC